MQLWHDLGGMPSPEEMERRLAEEQKARDAAWDRLCSRGEELRVIDFHTHTFPEQIAARALAKLSEDSCSKPFTGGTREELQASMKEAGVDLSIVLPVVTNPEKVAHINVTAAKQNCTTDETGILSFAGIHPAAENYRVLLTVAKKLGFKGIKLHPDYYRIAFNDIRTKRILEYASELDLIVVTHAGTDIGLYPPVYCTVDMIAEVMKDVHPVKLVAAHMGGWNNWDQVAEKLAGSGVWVDTAFSIGEIQWLTPGTPKHGFRQLSDEAFVRLVYDLGVDRVLFATDSPWAEQKDYVNRISSMPFTEGEKRRIFAENAKRLLGIPAADTE
jgi:hypothetical protein